MCTPTRDRRLADDASTATPRDKKAGRAEVTADTLDGYSLNDLKALALGANWTLAMPTADKGDSSSDGNIVHVTAAQRGFGWGEPARLTNLGYQESEWG
jgi:hypothetical protein